MEYPGLISEWSPQSGVMIAWPHQETDWQDMIAEVSQCYIALARAILRFEDLYVVTRQSEVVKELIGAVHSPFKIICLEEETNDTWIRDYGPLLSWGNGGEMIIHDFKFNAWGEKFEAHFDNAVTKNLFSKGFFSEGVAYSDHSNFVLEGGSIETDGNGTILTTDTVLLEQHRNPSLSPKEIYDYLKQVFQVKRVISLRHGLLVGDDTDGHIDTLVRFAPNGRILYTAPPRRVADEHYDELKAMEDELKEIANQDDGGYELIALPFPSPVYNDGERLPATYANYLYLNGAILLPIYHLPEDDEAIAIIKQAFPDREIVPIDCRALVKQHGSLHCATMQLPNGFTTQFKTHTTK